MAKAVKAETKQATAEATVGEPQYMQIQFFDPRSQQHYVIGTPLSRIDEKRMSRDGARGLYGTHTRGTDLLATMAPGAQGWTIAVEPIRGMFDFLIVPYFAKSSIDQVTV